MKKRRTKTTIEIHHLYVVRQGQTWPPILCLECPPGDASMVTPEEAAAASGNTLRRIYAGIEAGSYHYRELEDGSLLVCLASALT